MSLKDYFIVTKAKEDQRLVPFRQYYESRTPEQRKRFSELVSGISALMGGSSHEAWENLVHELGCNNDAVIGVTISVSRFDPDAPSIEMDPTTLAEAVACWEKDEAYATDVLN